MAIEPNNDSPAQLFAWSKRIAPLVCPTGMLAPFAAISDSSWEKADGRLLLRASYRGLFAIIGTSYNTGGETVAQFRLPNITLGGLQWYIKN